MSGAGSLHREKGGEGSQEETPHLKGLVLKGAEDKFSVAGGCHMSWLGLWSQAWRRAGGRGGRQYGRSLWRDCEPKLWSQPSWVHILVPQGKLVSHHLRWLLNHRLGLWRTVLGYSQKHNVEFQKDLGLHLSPVRACLPGMPKGLDNLLWPRFPSLKRER